MAALESREHEAPSLVSPMVFRTEEPASSRGVEPAGQCREPEPNPTCQEELCWVECSLLGAGPGQGPVWGHRLPLGREEVKAIGLLPRCQNPSH